VDVVRRIDARGCCRRQARGRPKSAGDAAGGRDAFACRGTAAVGSGTCRAACAAIGRVRAEVDALSSLIAAQRAQGESGRAGSDARGAVAHHRDSVDRKGAGQARRWPARVLRKVARAGARAVVEPRLAHKPLSLGTGVSNVGYIAAVVHVLHGMLVRRIAGMCVARTWSVPSDRGIGLPSPVRCDDHRVLNPDDGATGNPPRGRQRDASADPPSPHHGTRPISRGGVLSDADLRPIGFGHILRLIKRQDRVHFQRLLPRSAIGFPTRLALPALCPRFAHRPPPDGVT
jgi:hypothetical protein